MRRGRTLGKQLLLVLPVVLSLHAAKLLGDDCTYLNSNPVRCLEPGDDGWVEVQKETCWCSGCFGNGVTGCNEVRDDDCTYRRPDGSMSSIGTYLCLGQGVGCDCDGDPGT
jgi:hypothetical protein